ncbi:FAD-binding oxidoreductase [Rubellimicrobium sp. CFH 75288]|uniref:FAD-binding oxidoreductase n=1 Tax=Rubellimicrobium sp. CFH 75288 TaxID=2697034 RepID=UPI001411CBFB|nr:FAD-binding oxidoreductase [Rubellimicrobium sp. CFH 75288]NAZ35597.1 FAD-binding protein [Rubellimicrobium sp. CFH 75288]
MSPDDASEPFAGLCPADDAFERVLRAELPAAAFREATEADLTEPRGRWRGQGLVVAPGSAAEVATLLALCHEARVGVVPRSGGTGLVGGGLMPEGPPRPVLLSLDRMARIRALYPSENVLVAEAGCILADLQKAAREAGRLFPLSLASEGSARIGGLLATNAGGTAVLRWGNARALCLGLEAVTAEGRVWHGLTRLRKDNLGYDLRDLLIGSEGTLGVITAAALRLVMPPAAVAAALLAVPSPEAALELLALAQGRLGDLVQGFELIGRAGWDFLEETGLGACPLAPVPDWCVLVEAGLPEGLEPGAAMEGLFAAAAAAGLVPDGVLAASGAQAARLWALRERIPEANRRIGAVSSHDIAVPLGEIGAFLREADRAVAALGPFRVNAFGHLGDGNLHYNVFPPRGGRREDHEAQREAVKRAVHDLVHARGGSVAAEHGVGRLKVADLERYGDPVKLGMMRAVKAALDPKGILNPGAVLRA